MPFLRVIRDKRGYETTYLMDWYREGTRQRSRILYMFRTPSGVRVGRAALEPEVRRHIQSHYPDLAFDWKAVLDTRQVIDAASGPRRPPARGRTEVESSAAPEQPEGISPLQASRGRPPSPPFPSAIDGSTPDERIAFLADWYPVARERIARRTSDPVSREALMTLAEQLNPAAWTTPDEVTAGLLQASEALGRLSRVLTHRRRRSRGRPAGADTATPADDGGESEEVESLAAPSPDEVPSSGE